MKVLHIIDSLSVGGSENVAVNLTNALANYNIETFLCVTRKEGVLKQSVDKKVNYFFLDRTKIIDIKAFEKLRKYIIENNITVIHAHTTSSFIGFIIKLTTKKTVLIWHNHTGAYVKLKGFKLLILKLISFYFDAIVNVSKTLNEWTLKNLNSKNNFYVPNFAYFSNDSQKTKLKGITGKRIVCVAGLRPEKDHITLFKSFNLFLKDNQDWTLHIIGKDYKDTYSEELYKFITENNLEKVVFFYGECRDIKNVLSQATIAVLSSISEGLPISLLEYGLLKLPVICTDVGECGQVIKHNESGYLTKPKNEIEFASYLSKLANSKDSRIKFGDILNRDINLCYSKETVIRDLINIYNIVYKR
ncbi:MAG: glycosyltransferase [Flavobacteriaceae bacterium]